jgi:DNA-binding MarR family transcriptional regulator
MVWWMTEARWLTAEEDRMWRAFLQMQRALALAVDHQLAEAGLSAADFAVLVPLSETEDRALRVRDLAIGIGWDRSRIAHQLRRMEQRGLVSRFECPTDGRGTMVWLTDEGYAAIVAAAPGHVETVRRLLVDLLDAEDLARLTAIAERVVTATSSAVTDCPGETCPEDMCPG